MFEAIHGCAPRMVNEGRAQYANPTSMIVAGKMMLEHMGYTDRAQRLDMALDICGQYEKKLVMTSRDTGATGTDYANYVMETLQRPEAGRALAAVRRRREVSTGRRWRSRSSAPAYRSTGGPFNLCVRLRAAALHLRPAALRRSVLGPAA